MRGREIGYGQRQGRGRGGEPAEVVVGGGGQVLLGKPHWTAAVAGDVTTRYRLLIKRLII